MQLIAITSHQKPAIVTVHECLCEAIVECCVDTFSRVHAFLRWQIKIEKNYSGCHHRIIISTTVVVVVVVVARHWITGVREMR